MVKYWLVSLIIALAFGQLTRLPFTRGEVNVYFHDVLVVLYLLFWLFKKIKLKNIFLPKLSKQILGFVILALFSFSLAIPYFNSWELIVGLMYLLRWLAYSLVYISLIDWLSFKQNSGLINKLKNWLIFSGLLAAVFGLVQYLIFPDLRPLTVFGWDPHYFRVVGTYLDPGFTGLLFTFTLILILDKLWQNKDKLKLSMSWLVVYLSLALTYSRASYLAYLMAMLIIALKKKAFKFLSFVIGLGIVTLILLPRPGGEGVKLERQSTIYSRINNWKQTIVLGMKKPLFGHGFNLLRYVQRDLGILSNSDWQDSHAGAGAASSLLFVFATTGIVGLSAYLWLLSKIFVLSNKQKSFLSLACFGAVFVHSFFNNSLFYSWVMIWWWLVLGLSQSRKQSIED